MSHVIGWYTLILVDELNNLPSRDALKRAKVQGSCAPAPFLSLAYLVVLRIYVTSDRVT